MSQVMYGSLEDHAAAVMALLRDGGRLIVFPTEPAGKTIVPAGTRPPYVAVQFVADRPLGGRLDHRSTRMRMRIFTYCVGSTDAGARMVADLVAGVLLDVKPVIAGRTCYPIRSEGERPSAPREDESTGRLSSTITDLYRLESTPGPSGS